MPHNPFSDHAAETVAALGERRLIRALREWLGAATPPPPAGIGDDCASAPFDCAGKHVLTTVDSVVYGRHFDASVSPRRAGRKLVNRNLSDIAAMGGEADRAVVALMLPRRTRTEWLREFYEGMAEAALEGKLSIVGGDITETSSDLSASLTIIGTATRPMTRTGGRPGDLLAVTGVLGGSILGRHADFTPRLAEGRWLADRAEVLSLMDVTDGLAKDLPDLLPPGMDALLDPAKLPIHRDSRVLSARDGIPATVHALSDGEDYELILALDARADTERFLADWHEAFPKLPLTVFGRIGPVDGKGSGRLINTDTGNAWQSVGYSHLG